MEDVITLSILGKPLTFSTTSRVEACRVGKVRPGPCPKGTPNTGEGGGIAKKAVAKKAVAPKKAVAKKAAPSTSGATRAAEVKRLLAKKAHAGTPMDMVHRMFDTVADRPGWTVNKADMSAAFKGRHGTSTVRMIPEGYETQVTRPTPDGQPHVETRIWRNIGDAFDHARNQANTQRR